MANLLIFQRFLMGGVPEPSRKFQQKWRIALDLLDQLRGRLDYRALVFDAGYGEIGPFLSELEKRGEPYLAQVPRSHRYWPADIAVVSDPQAATVRKGYGSLFHHACRRGGQAPALYLVAG